MFIEILKYGDWESYTDCIMVSALDYNMKDLLTEFADEYSITPKEKMETQKLGKIEFSNDGQLKISESGISNISNHEYGDTPDLFIKFLRNKGFTELSTKSVCFSD